MSVCRVRRLIYHAHVNRKKIEAPYVDEVGIVALPQGVEDTFVTDVLQQHQIVYTMLKCLQCKTASKSKKLEQILEGNIE